MPTLTVCSSDSAGLTRGLNSLFWEEHKTRCGSGFFYNPTCGELMRAVQGRLPTPVTTGGFLCEEMGLGKTVEMLSLMLANPYNEQLSTVRLAATSNLDRFLRGGLNRARLIQSRATLVLVPAQLLGQWCDEVKKSVGKDLLHVRVWDAKRAAGAWIEEVVVDVPPMGGVLGLLLSITTSRRLVGRHKHPVTEPHVWVHTVEQGGAAAQLRHGRGDLYTSISEGDEITSVFVREGGSGK